MKNDLRLMMVSDLEADLIEAARNYVKTELFDEVIEIF